MDMLGFPNVRMDQFYEAIPELKDLDDTVQAKIQVEGRHLNVNTI